MMTNMSNKIDNQADLDPVMEALAGSPLSKIIQKARYLLALNNYFQTIIPAPMASDCQVMNVDQSILILGVTNAAVATRIRLISSELIEKLRAEKAFSSIQTIHCRVNLAITSSR